MPDRSLDLLHGTLDILVLRTLAWEPMHGYGVSRWIHDRTKGVLDLEDAALYKSLHRLERHGYIASEWGLSENNRKAKFYRLSARGRKQLMADTAEWRRHATAVAAVLA